MTASAAVKAQKGGARAPAYLFEWLQCIVFAIIVVMVLFIFVGRPMTVQKVSMNPTLAENDRLIVTNVFYTPKQGDIIVFSKASYEDGAPLVKRVIATEGQTVDINTEKGLVYVDNVALSEDYVADLTRTVYDVQFPYVVPDGCVFVMGDNRNNSIDSRRSDIGSVDTREILGKVSAVIMPFSHFKLYL